MVNRSTNAMLKGVGLQLVRMRDITQSNKKKYKCT